MNWKSIIATALVTGIITIATGIFLFWWQTKEPELTYNYVKSIPFDDSENLVFIQQFEITNSGNKTAENVSLVITFPQSEIEKSKIRIDNAITYTKNIEENVININMESLNPSEEFNLSVLLKSKSTILDDPIISLRAKGIVGEKVGSSKDEIKPVILIALLAAYAGIFAFMLSNKRYREVILLLAHKLFRGQGFSIRNQKDTIASILSMYGFPDKAKEYLNYGSSRRYWVEADLLAAEAISDNEESKKKMLQVLLHLADLVDMASSSKAIVFYNIARIYKSLSSNEFEDYIEKAREIDKNEIDERISKDPVFIEEISSNE